MRETRVRSIFYETDEKHAFDIAVVTLVLSFIRIVLLKYILFTSRRVNRKRNNIYENV